MHVSFMISMRCVASVFTTVAAAGSPSWGAIPKDIQTELAMRTPRQPRNDNGTYRRRCVVTETSVPVDLRHVCFVDDTPTFDASVSSAHVAFLSALPGSYPSILLENELPDQIDCNTCIENQRVNCSNGSFNDMRPSLLLQGRH
jgi:hypothetical protein